MCTLFFYYLKFVAVKNKFKKEDDINAGDLKFNVSNVKDNSSDEEEREEKDIIKGEKEEHLPTEPSPQTVCWYRQMLYNN